MDKKGVMKTVVELGGAINPSLGKSLQKAQKALGGIDLKAAAIGAACAAAGIVAVKAFADISKSLYDMGTQFNSAYSAIRIGTGATGEELNELKNDFRDVYSSVPTSMEDASKAISDYNTRLGVSGKTLTELSSQAIAVSNMLGEDLNSTIEASSKAFQQWNINTEDMGLKMDYVFKVSQATGAGFNKLMSGIKSYGPQMQQLGFSFEQAAAMMGQLEKAGVETDAVMGALKKSVGVFAANGINAADGFKRYYEAIKNAGDATKATTIATEVFGSKAGSTIAAAIRNGTLEIEAFTDAINASDESIMKAMWDTADTEKKMDLLGQQFQVMVEPLAGAIFDGIADLVPVFSDIMKQMSPVIQQIVQTLVPLANNIFKNIADMMEQCGPALKQFAEAIFPLIADILTALMPAFIQITGAILPALVQIITSLSPIIRILSAALGETLVQAINLVMPILTNLIDILANVIDFVVNVFTLHWGSAWKNIVNVFVDIFKGIAQLIKAPLNAVIGIINVVIAAINALKINIPDWIPGVGGKVFELNIPKIPMLASGGFTDGTSIAGEDGTEAVISFQPEYRNRNIEIWQKAGELLGADNTGGGTIITFGDIIFSPNIKVDGAGNIDEKNLMDELRAVKTEFVDFVEKELKLRAKKVYGN